MHLAGCQISSLKQSAAPILLVPNIMQRTWISKQAQGGAALMGLFFLQLHVLQLVPPMSEKV